MTTAAELFKPGSMVSTTVRFDTLCLRFAPGNHWHAAQWEFSIDGATTPVPAEQVAELSTTSDGFAVEVIDGAGGVTGPFTIQTVMGGYPRHCYCFLFRADDGMWSGHTVSKSFGQLAVVRHRFDPS